MTHDVEVLTPRDAFEAFDEIERRGLKPTVTILDPWHNKGVGGVMSDADYDAFIAKLLVRACAISAHVYLWGFPEIIGPYVRQIPASHGLVAGLPVRAADGHRSLSGAGNQRYPGGCLQHRDWHGRRPGQGAGRSRRRRCRT